MKKLNVPSHYSDYYGAADHPEIVDIEPASFISITAKGSFTEEIFYRRINILKKAVQAVSELFKNTHNDFHSPVLEGLYRNDEKYGTHTISEIFGPGPLEQLNYLLYLIDFTTGISQDNLKTILREPFI